MKAVRDRICLVSDSSISHFSNFPNGPVSADVSSGGVDVADVVDVVATVEVGRPTEESAWHCKECRAYHTSTHIPKLAILGYVYHQVT